VLGKLRLVRPDEYAAVGDLVVLAYETGGVLTTDDSYRAVLSDTAGRAAKADVYVLPGDSDSDGEGGRPVATVTLSPYGTAYAQVAGPGELEFRMLAVHPASAGQGLGAGLVRFCAEQARARGDVALVLCVIDTNQAAIRLYERLGFDHQPERDLVVGPEVRLLVYSCPV
jgi:ribosomal protein S18 acetylase RimI-like enzyme